MSNKNKSAKRKLIQLYGKECWIEKLHLRPPEDKPRRYTSKTKLLQAKRLTYHHIKPKSQGGRATVENGAVLSAENHAWFHKQPPEVQAKLNKIFQDFKQNYPDNIILSSSSTDTCPDISGVKIDYDEFISRARKHYNRAKTKRETQMLIKEEEDYER